MKLRTLLIKNANDVVFLCGFALLYVGIYSLSRPVANIIAGSLVMLIGAWPYVKTSKH